MSEFGPESRVFVAGHGGMVGAAIVRALQKQGHPRILSATRAVLDLQNQQQVNEYFASHRPEFVFLAAARVGGIQANNEFPAQFIRDNLQIQTNVISAAQAYGVNKLLFLGSSCIYPKFAPQPLKEEYLLTGALEPTNEWYALAKIAGLKMCQAFRREFDFDAISVMPTNLYGPGDNFDLANSHVLPALMRKCHEARLGRKPEVVVWGTGSPRREFLHVDDLAQACIYLMQSYSAESPINIGWGQDLTIKQLAEQVASVVGYQGQLVFDDSKPDGTPRKLLDTSRLSDLGWRPSISLQEGLRGTYDWFVENEGALRR